MVRICSFAFFFKESVHLAKDLFVVKRDGI